MAWGDDAYGDRCGVRAGAEIVKLFPMASLGLSFIRELQGPLNHIPRLPRAALRWIILRIILMQVQLRLV